MTNRSWPARLVIGAPVARPVILPAADVLRSLLDMGSPIDGALADRELTSWKEIATYLGVSTRTAQLWERDRGLPVRRLPGGRGLVYARVSELDDWKRSAASSSPGPNLPTAALTPPVNGVPAPLGLPLAALVLVLLAVMWYWMPRAEPYGTRYFRMILRKQLLRILN